MSMFRFGAAFGVFTAMVAGIHGVTACSSFTSTEAAASADGGAVDAAPSGADAEGAPDAAVPDDCVPLAPPTIESFDVGVEVMSARTVLGGTLSIDEGVLAATVPAATGARAYYGRTVTVPSADTFGRARLRFTLKELVWPPANFFVEGGCNIEVTNTQTGNRSGVRIELRPGSMKLDDVQFVDGGTADSGVGPELTTFTMTPHDYAITMDVVQDPAGTELRSSASVLGEPAVSKRTALAGRIDSIDLHCGINATSFSGTSNATYTVKIDDVAIELCKAPSTH